MLRIADISQTSFFPRSADAKHGEPCAIPLCLMNYLFDEVVSQKSRSRPITPSVNKNIICIRKRLTL
jgi:hypothetical protein